MSESDNGLVEDTNPPYAWKVSEKLVKFREKCRLRHVWLAFLSPKEEHRSLHGALTKIRTGNIPNTSPELEPTGRVPAFNYQPLK